MLQWHHLYVGPTDCVHRIGNIPTSVKLNKARRLSKEVNSSVCGTLFPRILPRPAPSCESQIVRDFNSYRNSLDWGSSSHSNFRFNSALTTSNQFVDKTNRELTRTAVFVNLLDGKRADASNLQLGQDSFYRSAVFFLKSKKQNG